MKRLRQAYLFELAAYRDLREKGDKAQAWRRLERAHILSQPSLALHIHCHGVMLRFAASQAEWHELVGQVWRLALAPLGSLFGRIPWGNTGRANVSAFVPMQIPADLKLILENEQSV